MLYILLSTYNGERYLAEQLDSILAQTYTEWKLFIRDDGSKDGTKAILKTYAEAHPERIFLDESESKGLGAMRSFEYLLAHHGEADYFAFADQDDVWDANKIAVCMEALIREETLASGKPVVVHSDLRVVDEQLDEIAPSFWRYSNIRPDMVDGNSRYLAISNSVTGCAMLFNHAAAVCSLPMSGEAYMHDAWVALMTVCHGGKVVPLHKATIAYRQHRHNVLGAVAYHPWGRSLSQRWHEAQISYRRSRGWVYRNRVQFFVWKIIFFVHRLLLGGGK